MPAAPLSANGGPGTGVSPPVVEMLNIEIFPGADEIATNFPSEVTLALANGPAAPVAKGDPGTWLRAPFAATLKTVRVIDAPLAAIRNLSSGVAANDTP